MRRKSVKNSALDIIVIGGGPAGLTMTAMLGTSGFSVLCIEREARKTKGAIARNDQRTTALSFSSIKILERCGLWPRLQKDGCPILDIRVADGPSPLHLEFHHRDVGDEPFGWIVENHIFHSALRRRVQSLKSVTLMNGAMQSLDLNGDTASVILENGKKYSAALIIGADGRFSQSREEAGIPAYGWKYPQTAIVCTIAHNKPHNNVAVEHFLPGGPLATLPMTKQRSSIVWTEKTAAAAALMKMSDAQFTEALEEKVEGWLGTIKLTGHRISYPLGLKHARRYTGKRFALIGDAAHGIHPIAGQGFNLGMGDIGVLAEELELAAQLGLDPGDATVLRRFEKRRKFTNGNMVFMTDVLDRLFSNSIPPVETARRFGLYAVQNMPRLRRFFMRTAMGREDGKTALKKPVFKAM